MIVWRRSRRQEPAIGAILEFDPQMSRRVEAVYTTPDVVQQRRVVREVLELRAGERVLDVGVGPGFLAAEMAAEVGPDGKVCGIDPSGSMLAIAQTRATQPGSAPVELKPGDANHLPYPDASFDVATATQVLEYVEDIPGALAELRRVLRHGGRVLVLDTDWDAVVWHSGDRERMRRVLTAWEPPLADPHLPRTLRRSLARARFDADMPLNCTGFDGGLGGWLGDLLGLFELTVVQGLVFCGWDVVERAVQAALIPPQQLGARDVLGQVAAVVRRQPGVLGPGDHQRRRADVRKQWADVEVGVHLGQTSGHIGAGGQPDVARVPVAVAGVVRQPRIAPGDPVALVQPDLLERRKVALIQSCWHAPRVVVGLQHPGGRVVQDQAGHTLGGLSGQVRAQRAAPAHAKQHRVLHAHGVQHADQVLAALVWRREVQRGVGQSRAALVEQTSRAMAASRRRNAA